MLIPLRTDRVPKRRPLVTEGLIVLNLLVYLAGMVGQFSGALDAESFARFGHFDPRQFNVLNLVSYQFLHDPHGIAHLAFNMLFLWVFGGAVEDRMGRSGFLGFYLLAGAVAAMAHVMVNRAPVIGASGSVAGVAGAFLALFPRSRIRVLFFFIIIGIYEIRSLWFIGFYVAIDLLRQTGAFLGAGGSEVAYAAHLAGYAYGFGTGFMLLATGILAHEDFDVFYLFRQARRRAAFRDANRGSAGGAWESASADTTRRLEKQTSRQSAKPAARQSAHRAAPAAPDAAESPERTALRGRINQLATDNNLAGAAAAYRELLAQDPGSTFAEQRQVDLANQLYREQHHATAAAAYELLLARFPFSRHVGEVSLMLALLYARRLKRPQRAVELIRQVRSRLSSQDHLALADQLLAELPS